MINNNNLMTKKTAIRRIYEESGLSVSEFARTVGYTRNQVYLWLNGKSDIRKNNLEIIASRLNYQADWQSTIKLQLQRGKVDMNYNAQDKQTINNQNELIVLLKDQIEVFKDRIDKLENELDNLKTDDDYIPELQINENQALIDTESQTILNCTSKYAKFYEASPLHLIGTNYFKLLHTDELKKIEIMPKDDCKEAKGYSDVGLVKCVTVKGNTVYAYVEMNNIGHNKIMISIQPSTAKDYENKENKAQLL